MTCYKISDSEYAQRSLTPEQDQKSNLNLTWEHLQESEIFLHAKYIVDPASNLPKVEDAVRFVCI